MSRNYFFLYTLPIFTPHLTWEPIRLSLYLYICKFFNNSKIFKFPKLKNPRNITSFSSSLTTYVHIHYAKAYATFYYYTLHLYKKKPYVIYYCHLSLVTEKKISENLEQAIDQNAMQPPLDTSMPNLYGRYRMSVLTCGYRPKICEINICRSSNYTTKKGQSLTSVYILLVLSKYYLINFVTRMFQYSIMFEKKIVTKSTEVV